MGLKLLVSFCAKCHDSVVKSRLLRHSHATRHNHWHGSSPQKEKHRFAKKTFFFVRSRFSCFFLSEKESLKGVFKVFVKKKIICGICVRKKKKL